MFFFTNDMGGNMMMYINLIWAWGHPEVYILILPVFGVFSEIAATFSRKRLFGYTSLVWATVCIMWRVIHIVGITFYLCGWCVNRPNKSPNDLTPVAFGIASIIPVLLAYVHPCKSKENNSG